MKNKKKLWIGCGVLVALIVVFALIYKVAMPKPQQGTKAYTLEVVDDQGATKTYEGKTDAEYLRGLMDELQEQGDFSYDGTDSDYGIMIEYVNDLRADYNEDGAYWSIMVNGEYGQFGADSQPVADGDAFQLVYTPAE